MDPESDSGIFHLPEEARSFLDSANDAIFIADDRGVIVEINHRSEELLGLPRDQILGKHQSELHPPEDRERYRKIFQDHKALGKAISEPLEVVHSSGKRIPVEISAKNLVIEGKTHVLGLFRDISERIAVIRELEHQRDLAQKYFDVANVILLILNPQAQIVHINRKGAEILGYSVSEIVGKNWFDSFIPSRMAGELKGVFESLIHGQVQAFTEYANPVRTRKGDERLIEWRNTYLRDENGFITHTLSSGEDVTERVHAEESLREARDFLQAIYDASPDMIFIHGADGRLIDVNANVLKAYQCSKDAILQNDPEQFMGDGCTKEQAFQYVKRALDGESVDVEWMAKRADGTQFPVEVRLRRIGEVLRTGKNEPIAVALVRNLEELRRAEKKVKESEARFRAITETARDSIFIKDMDRRYTFVNPSMARLFGVSQRELLGKCPEDLFPPEAATIIREVDNAAFSGEIVDEIRELTIGGKIHYFHTVQVPLEMEGDRVHSICGIVRDITESKQAEEKIRESEEHYRTLLQNIQDGVFLIQDNIFKYVNEAFARMVGMSSNDLLSLPFDSIIAPEDHDWVVDRYTKRQAGEDVPDEYEFRLLHRNGSRVHVFMHVGLLNYKGSVASLGTLKDITDQKRSEQRLKESEEHYRTLVEHIHDGVFLLQGQKMIFANEAFAEMLGYTHPEFMAVSYEDILAPEDKEMVLDRYARRQAGESIPSEYDIRLIHKEGHRLYCHITAGLIQYMGAPATLGTIRDTTRERKTQAQLRMLSSAVEQSGSIIIITNPEGAIEYVNERFVQVTGWPREEAIGKTPDILQSDYHDPQVHENLWRTVKAGDVWSGELVNRKKTGELFWVHLTVSPLKDDDGAITHMIGIEDDITEKKLSEERIRESEERFRSLYENALIGIYRTSPDGKVLMANPALVSMLGYSSFEDLSSIDVRESGYKDACTRKEFLEVIHASGTIQGFEAEWKRKDGSSLFVRENSTVVRNDAGEVLYYDGTVEDITSIVKSQRAVIESEVRYRTLIEQASDAIYIVSDDARILQVNQAACNMTGYSKEELIGKLYTELIPERDLKRLPLQIPSLREKRAVLLERTFKRKDGTEFPVEISAVRLPDGTLQGIGRDITDRKRAESIIRDSDHRLRTQNRVLLDLTKSAELSHGDLPAFIRQVTRKAAETLDVERVSVWMFSGDGKQLDCIDLYSRSDDFHDSGIQLAVADFPVYFKSIRESRTIATDDVLTDPRTREFANGYLKPNHISSMIDAQIRIGGEVIGILCHEHIGPRRAWEFDEELFAASMADLVSLAVESSNRKKSETALQESELRYALAAKGANDGLWDWDLKHDTVYYSPRWKSMLGFAEEEISSKPGEWLERIHEDDRLEVESAFQAHLAGLEPHFEREFRIVHRDGTYRWVLARGMAVRDEENRPIRMAGSQTDITDRKRAEEQLLHDAFHDALTLLPNRALFTDRLGQAIERTRRSEETTFAVLHIDLDRFKVINESLGHLIGDRLLIRTGELIRGSLLPGDTVARLGGDEFAILVEDVEDPSEVTRLADRILTSFQSPITIGEHEIYTSACIGISFSHIAHSRPELYLRDAESAMYKAKVLGRGSYAIFEAGMHARAVSILKLENELRSALNRKEFNLHYQPIINLDLSKVHGFEALIRWKHPERGLMTPDDFLTIATDAGYMAEIDRWVIGETCRQLSEWKSLTKESADLSCTVNLSNHILYQPDLPEFIGETLRICNLSPDSLGLEITEGMIMERVEDVTSTLFQLKALGVKLLVDDFGTGYSSLSYLHQFPLDFLKIDRSFIMKMKSPKDRSEIVSTIISLGHHLNMKVMGEGVEMAEQIRALKDLGCNYAQGYHISRPLTARDAADFVKQFDISTILFD
ncbi:MAG TPA: PAS domain S-box protein [Thermoanaerobaculia bacterium]|nr:PAS domain S-box protein [Thermoanaerobaculia bacterium]HUM29010.1 PAS domain S-box protein [Thermoanaerobaculia bacterium]HXK67434.1 PAS domain S-box protein [Thermoanaerobaculia bacterium]